ncbi:MAG: hypothetical protein AAFP04_09580 [Myxococcota bacterium]
MRCLCLVLVASLLAHCTPRQRRSTAEPEVQSSGPGSASIVYDAEDSLTRDGFEFLQRLKTALNTNDRKAIAPLVAPFSLAYASLEFGRCWGSRQPPSEIRLRCDPDLEQCVREGDETCSFHRIDKTWQLGPQPWPTHEQRAAVAELKSAFYVSYNLASGQRLQLQVNGHHLEPVESSSGFSFGSMPITGYLDPTGKNRMRLRQSFVAKKSITLKIRFGEQTLLERPVALDVFRNSKETIEARLESPPAEQETLSVDVRDGTMSSSMSGSWKDGFTRSFDISIGNAAVGSVKINIEIDQQKLVAVVAYSPNDARAKTEVPVWIRVVHVPKIDGGIDARTEQPVDDFIGQLTPDGSGLISKEFVFELPLDSPTTAANQVSGAALEAQFKTFRQRWTRLICAGKPDAKLGEIYGVVNPTSLRTQTETARAFFCDSQAPSTHVSTSCDETVGICELEVEHENDSGSHAAGFAFRQRDGVFRACEAPIDWGGCSRPD